MQGIFDSPVQGGLKGLLVEWPTIVAQHLSSGGLVMNDFLQGEPWF